MQAVALFKSYFGGAFDEDAIRNNFVLIYELLDGMLMFEICFFLDYISLTMLHTIGTLFVGACVPFM